MTVTVLYFSSSGNTEKIAHALAERVRKAGCRVLVTDLADARVSDLSEARLLLVGSPAWSGEQVVEPLAEFLTENIENLRGKRVAFFGSYDWGEGKYFDNFARRLRAQGVDAYERPLLFNVRGEECTSDDAEAFLHDVLGRPSEECCRG